MNIQTKFSACLLSAAMACSTTTHAFTLLKESGQCPGGIHHAADELLMTNVANMSGSGATDFANSVEDIVDRINAVGGVWFDYVLLPTTVDWAYGTGVHGVNGNGLSEIGLANLSAFEDPDSDGNLLGMGPSLVNLGNCTIIESDTFLDSNDSWDHGVPESGGATVCASEECYFNVSSSRGPDNRFYSRPVVLHELGHNIGLAHEPSDYSIMNYGVKPWTNRSDEKRVEFLPDDREALRHVYPGTATERDVAATVTWPEASGTSEPALASILCNPSTGDSFSSSVFSDFCGVNDDGSAGSTNVCPGDTLYTRYAMANYSNVSLDVVEELWFSKNKTLNTTAGVDIESPTQKAEVSLNPNRSYRKGRSFEVPEGLEYGREYYPIIFINSGNDYDDEESQQNNWIPLRQKIQVKPIYQCKTFHQGELP